MIEMGVSLECVWVGVMWKLGRASFRNTVRAAGCGRIMDAFRNDLKNIQGGLKELLSKVGPIEVPSWRFPEKTATSVNLEEVLKGVGPTGGDSSSKVLVLELLVDR